MANKKRSPKRSEQLQARKLDSKLVKIGNDKARLFVLSPGGSRLHPMEVGSTAVIEGRAASVPCPQCDGRLAVKDHSVDRQGKVALRRVKLRCVDCASPQSMWFRVAPPRPN